MSRGNPGRGSTCLACEVRREMVIVPAIEQNTFAPHDIHCGHDVINCGQFLEQTHTECRLVPEGLDPVWPGDRTLRPEPFSGPYTNRFVLVLGAGAVFDIQPGHPIFPNALPHFANNHPGFRHYIFNVLVNVKQVHTVDIRSKLVQAIF